MSRTRFWTILIGTEPTSFRAAEADALVPTLKQLQRKHPEAVLRYYEGGQLFESEAAAMEAHASKARDRRPRDWRPGGDHRDPRARYEKTRDEKRRLFKLRQRGPRGEGELAPGGARPPASSGRDRQPDSHGASPEHSTRRPLRPEPRRNVEGGSTNSRTPGGQPRPRPRGPSNADSTKAWAPGRPPRPAPRGPSEGRPHDRKGGPKRPR